MDAADSNYRQYHSPEKTNLGAGNTTDLHKACTSPSSSLSKLRATLLALGKSSASQPDEEGRLALHLLGRNELLIHLFLNQARYDVTGASDGIGYGTGWDYDDGSIGQQSARGAAAAALPSGAAVAQQPGMLGGSGATRSPRTELDSFVVELVRAYPRAVVCTDGVTGRIPMVDAIYDWIEYSSRDVPGMMAAEAMEDEENNANNNRGGVDRYESSNLGMGSARDGQQPNFSDRRVEGMSQLMGHDEDERIKKMAGGKEEASGLTGKRSVLTNLSLPSAFRSAYSASNEVDGVAYQSRASYRLQDAGLDDPAERQRSEFRNTWSATVPRNDDQSHDEHGDRGVNLNNNGVAGGASRAGQQQAARSVGQSDVISNPPEDADIDDVFPLNLAMPPVVEWSLRMLSIILDGLESADGPLGADESEAFAAWRAGSAPLMSGDSQWIANSLVSSVASIPSLMKTLLLLNDSDPVKARVFNLSIIRRAISSKYTIGNWLVYMLEAVDPVVARRGVDYLEILSEDEDENALIPSTKRVRFAGTQLSPSQRAALYYKVSKLDYFLPAILALEETAEVDRAAKTKLLRHILDKELGSRPTLTMAFFDLFLLLVLLVTFQMSAYHVVDGAAQNSQYMTTYFLSLIGILYAILRKFGQMSSMIKISRQAFIENNFRWVDAIDWLAIALATGGVIWMEVSISTNYEAVPVTDYMRSYLAAAICALWFKLVSWLSVINWQVINLVQLLQQMFYVMLSGKNCDANGYCEKQNAYLQVWSILLGQFNIDDFQSVFSVISFVAFTFVAFILLGYALIATAIDCYNKQVTFRSENSAYGNRSRLVYIAELRAFRRLFDQRWTVMQYCAALLFFTSTLVVFLFAAAGIRNSLGAYYSGGIVGGAVALLLIFLFVSIMAFVSHMTYYSFVENNGANGCGSKLCQCIAANAFVRFLSHPMEILMCKAVDVDGIHLDGTPSTAKYTDSWQGSATHIRCHVKRELMSTERHIASRMKNELFTMEMRHKKANERSRADVLTEIRASEERMERMLSDFQSWMERRIDKED
ncbi:hypothetical protein QTG54_007447 [Skeletonema marinoi]|uniref:Ion transport domain-containing protein n=1 Tax=Skeletonema marinoi TaxID=267567 RepID=A0AAD8YA61_9STRA|nr:hypothetical protein QTG54_007447 [Skeletonema marinoi]